MKTAEIREGNRNRVYYLRDMRIILLFTLSVFLLSSLLFAVKTTQAEEENPAEKHAYTNPELIKLGASATYDIEYKLTFKKTAPGQVTKFLLRVVIPKDIPPIQEIVEIRTVPDITRTEIDENGNKIAYFDLGMGGYPGDEKEFILQYRVKVTEFKLVKVPKEGPLPDSFTAPEEYIESDNPRIVEASEAICAGESTAWDKTRAIYDFVRKNIKYEYSRDDLGALFALDNRRGDCTDYAYLMIALCRAQRIPARFVNSFSYYKGAPSNLHNWLEVYTSEFGWVPMDPEEGSSNSLAYFAGKDSNTVIWYVDGASSLLEGYQEYYFYYHYKDRNPHIEDTRTITVKKVE